MFVTLREGESQEGLLKRFGKGVQKVDSCARSRPSVSSYPVARKIGLQSGRR